MNNSMFTFSLTQQQRLKVARWYDKSLVAGDKEVDIIANEVEYYFVMALVDMINKYRVMCEDKNGGVVTPDNNKINIKSNNIDPVSDNNFSNFYKGILDRLDWNKDSNDKGK